jgi:hypothetical protein
MKSLVLIALMLVSTVGYCDMGKHKLVGIVYLHSRGTPRIEFVDWQIWLDCGVGELGVKDKVSHTPIGIFKVVYKGDNPLYFDVHGKFIAGPYAKDKANVYGTRIIGLDYIRNGRHLCIHGTNEPDKIPGYVSHMCVRLKNEDVEWLYKWIEVGDEIRIEP